MIQGIAVALGLVLWIFTQLPIYPKVKGLMEKYKIFQQQQEKVQLLGDDLSSQNLKETTQRISKKISDEISERLDEMDECVTVFYENLMTEEIKRKAFRIKEHINEINNIIENHERSLNGTKENVGAIKSQKNSNNQSQNKIKNYNDNSANKLVPLDVEEVQSDEEGEGKNGNLFQNNEQNNHLYGSNGSNGRENPGNPPRKINLVQQFKERQNSHLNLSGNRSVHSSNSARNGQSPGKVQGVSHKKKIKFSDTAQREQEIEQGDEDFELIENGGKNKPPPHLRLNQISNQKKQIINFDDSEDSEDSDTNVRK